MRDLPNDALPDAIGALRAFMNHPSAVGLLPDGTTAAQAMTAFRIVLGNEETETDARFLAGVLVAVLTGENDELARKMEATYSFEELLRFARAVGRERRRLVRELDDRRARKAELDALLAPFGARP